MPRSGALLEATIGFYGQLAKQAAEQLRTTQEELRTETFSIDKTIARGLSLWLDAVDGVFSAVLIAANGPVPTLFVRVSPDATTVTQEINVTIPDTAPFSVTPLTEMGGSGSVSSRTFSALPTSKKNAIEVKLVDLKNNRPRPGLYQALAYAGDKALAIILVQVEAAPPKPGA